MPEYQYYIYLLLIASGFVMSIINRKQLGAYSIYITTLLGVVLLFESVDYLVFTEVSNTKDHIYQPLEFTLMILMYGKAIKYSWFDKIILPFIVGFWVVGLSLSVWVEGLENYNSLSFSLSSFLIILFAAVYHFQLLTSPKKEERLFTQPFFWINTAHLFYYSGVFFQMGFDAYLLRRAPELADTLVTISYIFNLALYSLYLVGFTCKQIFKSR